MEQKIVKTNSCGFSLSEEESATGVHWVPYQQLKFNASRNRGLSALITRQLSCHHQPQCHPFSGSLAHSCARPLTFSSICATWPGTLTYCSVTQNKQFSGAIFCLIASCERLVKRQSVPLSERSASSLIARSTCGGNASRNKYTSVMLQVANQKVVKVAKRTAK